MNICVLSWVTRKAGGLFYAVSSLCKALDRPGTMVSIIGRADDLNREDLKAWAPVPVCPYKAYGPLGSSIKLRPLLRTSGADIVHQHGIWMDDHWAAMQWQKNTGRPVVISPHGMLDPWAVRNSAWKKELVGWLFANESLRKSACIHALCQSEAEAIRDYGLKNPIAVIPNGVALPDFECSTFNFQRPTKRLRLLFLGRIHPKKGLSELIKAWSMAQGPWGAEWELVIAGWDDGGHLDGLKKQATSLGLQWSVDALGSGLSLPPSTLHFVGPKFGKEKDALLRSVDAFILPSFSEGLPMSVLEAWSYGLPVIMTPQCNIPLGFDLAAAIQIAPEKNRIAEGLRQFFAMSEDDQKAMGLRGRRMVEEQFTWGKIAEDMCDVYKWVLGGGSQPDCVRLD
ncbi:MAG: glycosyltransferase [Desulfuromonadaceae bacterium]|nr:glycosyltransferase [Desulfuromonadaceae bacterium]